MNGRVVAAAALNRRLIDAVINKAIDALSAGETEVDLLEFLRDEDWHPQLVRVADALAALKERRDKLGLPISELLCLDNQPWVLCAFCEEGYVRRDDPEWAKRAGEHVASCEKHPLHAALKSITPLREACKLALSQLRASRDGGRLMRRDTLIDSLESALAGGVA